MAKKKHMHTQTQRTKRKVFAYTLCIAQVLCEYVYVVCVNTTKAQGKPGKKGDMKRPK